MKTPDEVAEMLRLRACGWGLKRIARQLGCSHHTVKDYVLTGVKAFKSPERPKRLDGLEGRLRERFIRHRGNADVARQDLLAEKHCSQPANAANRRAPPSPGGEGRGVGDDAVRNTPGPAAADRLRRASGRDRRGEDQSIRVVATLGHSRRLHFRASLGEKQEHWFAGLESAFTTFGAVPEELLMDNLRALVVRHDAVSRSVQFNDKLIAFAKLRGSLLGPARGVGRARRVRRRMVSPT